jgi:hypothetical protein
MDNEDGKAITPVEAAIPAKTGDAEGGFSHLFRPMFDDALRATRRVMLNSEDESMVLRAAENIFDRGGAARKAEKRDTTVVNISESDVKLLILAAREAQ